MAILLLGTAAPTLSNTSIHDAYITDLDALTIAATDIANSDRAFDNNTDINNTVSLDLSALGRNMVLQLKPSRFNDIALKHSKPGSAPALFEGVVSGDKDSWVRITLQSGKLNGNVYHYGELYQLEHKTYLNNLNVTHAANAEHILFRASLSGAGENLLKNRLPQKDHVQFAPIKPAQDNQTFNSLLNQLNLSSIKNNTETFSIRNGDGFGTSVTRALRLGIFIDSRFNEAHNNRGLARALSIMSGVDAIYQTQLGIAVLVEGTVVYEDPNTDPMRNRGGTVSQILDQFRDVRIQQASLPADLSMVHLFTGHRDPDQVIGLGWKSTTCRLDGYDISVSSTFPFDTLLAAHELAHNLGAVHDGDLRCAHDPSTDENTLMWPAISGTTTSDFSSCSRVFVQSAIDASCNMDNIDSAIDIRTYPTSEYLRRSVVIEVSNNDLYGRDTELFSTTHFPSGTTIQDLSAGCVATYTTVECNHGTVDANTSSMLAMAATLPNEFNETVVTNIELLNASDIYNDDNRKAILMLQTDYSSQAVALDDLALEDETTETQGDFVSFLGSPSAWLLLVLGLAGYSRRKIAFLAS